MNKKFLGLFFSMASLVCAQDILISPNDAKLSGAMKMKDSRYITGWNSKDVFPSWSVEVPEDGEFNFFAELAIPDWSKGAKLQLFVDGVAVSDLFTVKGTKGHMGEYFVPFKITNKPIFLKNGKREIALKVVESPKVYMFTNIRLGLLTKAEKVDQILSPVLPESSSFADLFESLHLKSEHDLTKPEIYRFYHWAAMNQFPHEMNWILQDANDLEAARKNSQFNVMPALARYFEANRSADFERNLIRRVLSEISEIDEVLAKSFLQELLVLEDAKTKAGDSAWLDLYVKAARRVVLEA